MSPVWGSAEAFTMTGTTAKQMTRRQHLAQRAAPRHAPAVPVWRLAPQAAWA